MPRNSSTGAYSAPASTVNPAVANTVISEGDFNALVSDLSTALAHATSTTRALYPTLGQVQDGGALWGGTAAGTADALTITLSPAITAYAAGQRFRFISSASANTGAATLNVNGVGAKNIRKLTGATALGAGDIPASTVTDVVYDGTQFILQNRRANGILGVQVFTSGGTYTATAGTRAVLVQVQAGGGGSGGAGATNAGDWAVGGAGAGGGYGEEFIASGFDGTTVTVGAGGAGGSAGANAGSTGGTSSFGAFISCAGGGGGSGGVASSSAPAFDQSGIAAGGTATGADFAVPGGAATGPPIALTVGLVMRPAGGAARMGPGGAARTVSTNNAAGATPAGYGGGGAGPINANSTFSAAAGAAGAPGIVIVTELG